MKRNNFQKNYDKFLKSNKSNYISHSINKLQKTYLHIDQKNEKILTKIKKFIYYLFDSFQLDKFIKKDNTDVLIISNFLDHKSLSNDVYFGKLNEILKSQNIKTKKIYRNFINVNHKILRNDIKIRNLILGKRLILIEELFHFILALREVFIFLFSIKYKDIKKKMNIFDFLSIINNLRHVEQLTKCIKKLNPKIIIFTFEGHAWERMLNFNIKQFDNKIITIGYQFSIIKRSQIGFFRELKKDFNPDYLAASGEITFKYLKKKIKHSKILKLGSNKWRPVCKSSQKFILIALDDSQFLEDKMLDLCIKITEVKLIIRLHPLVKNDRERFNKINKKISKNKNIYISNKTLDQDLAKSKYTLFINSSIAFEGLFFNVIPIFFNNNIKSNIFDKKYPKNLCINSKIELLKLIYKKNNFDNIQYFKNYQKKYFEKYKIKEIKKLLN